MYRKVHLRLTVLCAGITTAIIIIMSLSYLYVSEKGLYTNQYNSFKNDINTIATNLEQQSVITMEWLSKMEAQGNYTFFVLDNGVPFLYNQITGFADDSRLLLLNECLDAYNSMFSVSQTGLFTYNSYHLEFRFHSSSTLKDYFGGVISLERDSSLLEVVILSSLDALEHQIFEQRIRFLIIDITAIVLLTIFSFVFTGKLLKPILENQQKQAAFVASASHELRTPLAVILSSAECCTDASPDQQAKFLKTIKNEGLRMSSLINDMLTLSGSDNHRFSIQKEPVEMDTLLMNSYEGFEPLAKEKNLTLSIELPENSLPMCTCDPNRISQVISILLHNAISYTPRQGRIVLSLSFKKGNFHISVQDNGIGISDEDKKKIFDRFYRAEKSRSTKGHFGLGLSIAYEIVSAHRGSICVADAEKGGCIFTVILPKD
ncbi:MAG: HAMP domain-containing sensor histidine kinase [Bacillota bacterium]|nr:HAMP domain-containing sensor histidine kinase [Bacillota bacterium]